MVKSVRVGVWGLGRHGRRKILPALNICPDTSLVGVTTRDRRVAKEEAARHGCHAWRTPEEMLNDPLANRLSTSSQALPISLKVLEELLALRC